MSRSDRERVEGFQHTQSVAVWSSPSERVEGFQRRVISAVPTPDDERVEGRQDPLSRHSDASRPYR